MRTHLVLVSNPYTHKKTLRRKLFPPKDESMSTPAAPLRIALLGGFKDNAAKRMRQCKTLRERLPGIVLVGHDAPFELSPAEIAHVSTREELAVFSSSTAETANPGNWRKWWSLPLDKVTGAIDDDFMRNPAYDTLEESVRDVCAWLEREGPFDGLLGFSQGAVLVACLVRGHVHALPASIRCAILVGGFPPSDTKLLGRVEEQQATSPPRHVPTLHMAGRADTYIDARHSEALRQWVCSGDDKAPPLWLHGGGHLVPSDAASRNEIKRFFAASLAKP
jgi:predicted esterase